MTDARYMALALRMAARARGRTSPNPLVGCVVVRDGEILSTGYHRAAGRAHAELEALERIGFSARGATLYVNLEPCCHFGRTPPCTDAILRAGVRRVVAGMIDPNPLVAGKGLERLRQAGVEVEVGLLEPECRALNEAFCHAITTGRPFVTLKSALTLDGRTATRSGHSQWISSEAARARAHRLRAESDAILVGIGTVLADDPRLTVRLPGHRGRQPLRVILDSALRVPESAAVLRLEEAPTVIFTGPQAPVARREALARRGIDVVEVPAGVGGLDLGAILAELGRRQVVSLMVEAGPRLAGSLADAGYINRYVLFLAPRILGGSGAPGLVGGIGVDTLPTPPPLEIRAVRRVGPDVMIEASPRRELG